MIFLFMFIFFVYQFDSGNRVKATATPWMTGKYPFDPQPGSFERAVFFDGLKRVPGTGWSISARLSHERGKRDLIHPD